MYDSAPYLGKFEWQYSSR